MKRRIFVGDIQGCRDELERLLELAAFQPGVDELHPVGDLVNRGPDSLGVLRLLASVDAGGVLGNHDAHLLRVAAGERASGPRDTFHDVLAAPDRAALLAWLAARPVVREWSDVILVHAGLHPAWTRAGAEGRSLASHFDRALRGEAAEHARRFALTVRYCAEDGSRPAADWPPPGVPYRPWFEFLPGHPSERRTVVFGHWARLGRVERPRLRGLDTGCVWGKTLTAWIAEDDRWLSVDARRAYSTHRE
ncbi:MAG: metallophosphoesterase [bacterium]